MIRACRPRNSSGPPTSTDIVAAHSFGVSRGITGQAPTCCQRWPPSAHSRLLVFQAWKHGRQPAPLRGVTGRPATVRLLHVKHDHAGTHDEPWISGCSNVSGLPVAACPKWRFRKCCAAADFGHVRSDIKPSLCLVAVGIATTTRIDTTATTTFSVHPAGGEERVAAGASDVVRLAPNTSRAPSSVESTLRSLRGAGAGSPPFLSWTV